MSNGFPIHAYGTGQIMSAISDWRNRERQREDEMIKILTNQIATGNVAAITPDVRAKLNKRGISDSMISGLERQGAQERTKMELLQWTADIKKLDVLETMEKSGVDLSTSPVAQRIAQSIKSFDVNTMLSVKEIKKQQTEKTFENLTQEVGKLTDKSEWGAINDTEQRVQFAMAKLPGEKYQQVFKTILADIDEIKKSKRTEEIETFKQKAAIKLKKTPSPQTPSAESQEYTRQIQSIQDELNEIRRIHGAGKVDILAMMSLPSEERNKWLKSQTGPILDRIKNREDKIRYRRLMARLSQLVTKQAGGLPQIKGTAADADHYIQLAGGDIEKAKELALADGILLE